MLVASRNGRIESSSEGFQSWLAVQSATHAEALASLPGEQHRELASLVIGRRHVAKPRHSVGLGKLCERFAQCRIACFGILDGDWQRKADGKCSACSG